MFDQRINKCNYDNEHDVLYIFIDKPSMAYEDEISPGIFLRKDDDTDKIIGAIIMGYRNFKKDFLSKVIPFSVDYDQINRNIIQ